MSTAVRHVGQDVRRLGGEQFVTGATRYVAYDVPSDAAHLALVRSTSPHARIVAIELDRARSAPGVVGAFTGEDARRLTQPVPHFIDAGSRGGQRADVWCLAVDRVRWVGEPVAAVVAESRRAAQEAADLVTVRYDELPPVLDVDTALAPETPPLYEGWTGNVVLATRMGDPAEQLAAALAAAPHRLREELRIHRFGTAPMEPRAYLASWDELEEPRMTVRATTQNPHPLREMLAHGLGLASDEVRVIAPHIGGGFGFKMPGHPEELLVCMASRALGRPVLWLEERHENLLGGGREQIHDFEVGFDDDGRLLALHDRIVAVSGAVSAQPGWSMAPLSSLTIPTGYRVGACAIELRIVATNKPPWTASRGYGKEGANLLMERVIERVARQLGRDSADVRRLNFVRRDDFPFRTATGLNLDSGDYHHVLDQLLELADVPRWRALQAQSRRTDRRLGVGLAFELTPEASDSPGMMGRGVDSATVRITAEGRIEALTGVTSPGGGNETGIAQIVADELDVEPEDVVVLQGDTAVGPFGYGNYSGRSTVLGGNAAALAARELRARLDRGAVPPVEVTREYKPGNTSQVPDPRGRIQPYPTYSNAAFAVVVDVDAETGRVAVLDVAVVHDCGVMINPALVEGQMRGAVAMGLGGVLSEETVFRADGSLASDRFKAYLLPRANDLPPVRMGHHVTPSPFTELGTKGAGEAGVGGAMSAVVNAVEDALAPEGVVVRSLPLTPPAVRRLIATSESARRPGR